MKLNHINLPVGDVAASRDFLVEYFGLAVVMELPRNMMAVLRDDGDMVLILSHFDREATAIAYHPDFHIGFYFETNDEVDAMHVRLSAGGVVADAPHKAAGRYGAYYPAPGGFMVEVACLKPSSWVPQVNKLEPAKG